jgi:hypothetical protein
MIRNDEEEWVENQIHQEIEQKRQEIEHSNNNISELVIEESNNNISEFEIENRQQDTDNRTPMMMMMTTTPMIRMKIRIIIRGR